MPHGHPLPPRGGQVYYFAGESVARDAVIFNFSEWNEDEGEYQFQSMKLCTSKPNGFAAATEACWELAIDRHRARWAHPLNPQRQSRTTGPEGHREGMTSHTASIQIGPMACPRLGNLSLVSQKSLRLFTRCSNSFNSAGFLR